MPRRMETDEDRRRKNEVDLASYHRLKDDPEWLERHRALGREYQRAYTVRNRERINARRRELFRERYRAAKAAVIKALGGCCHDCRINDLRVLEIDHVNGGGGVHRRSGSSLKIFKHMMEHLEEYQLLCANCHTIKTYRQPEG